MSCKLSTQCFDNKILTSLVNKKGSVKIVLAINLIVGGHHSLQFRFIQKFMKSVKIFALEVFRVYVISSSLA